MNKTYIAWGASRMLHLYLQHTQDRQPFDCCIDSYSPKKEIHSLPIKGTEHLEKYKAGEFCIVIFAVTNNALREISTILSNMGLTYGDDFMLYSDFLRLSFNARFKKSLGFIPTPGVYEYARSATLNSHKPVHTTILGTQLFLECLLQTKDLDGDIAEIGAFEGGNAFLAQQFCAANKLPLKTYHIFDSFEGFPAPASFEANTCSRGDYCTHASAMSVMNDFRMFDNTRVIKGFVPDTFTSLPETTRFSLVFYDCDLYQPALDTYAYCWDRLAPGGYLLIHDYMAEPGGFEGVKKATDEFFAEQDVMIHAFYENTMAVIQKEQ